MNVKQTQYHTDPEPRYRCPKCQSDDVRISAVIDCTVRPNHPQDPVEDFAMLEAYAAWEEYSDAWCDACHWQGLAGQLDAGVQGVLS